MDGESGPTKLPGEKDFRFSFNFKLRKKFLLYALLPLVILALLIVGLIQQGILGGVKKASLAVRVVDEKQQAIPQAIVEAGSLSGITGGDGNVVISGEIAGSKENVQVSIRKTGFIPYSQATTLKKGKNDLGTVVLKETPVEKLDLTVSVTDYISEEVVKDAVVAIADIGALFDETASNYKLPNVPLGAYSLSVSKSGYNGYSTKIEVTKDTKALEPIKLVPAGVIVFESNRDRGKRGLFTANYDGSDQKALIERIGDLEDYTPSLGPNQRKLFFTSTRDGVKREDNPNYYKEFIYIVDIDGKNLAKISETSSGYTVWSPDGGYIGFTKYTADYSKSEVYTYDVVKKATHQFSGYNSSSFSFSADGQQIAFSGLKEGETANKVFYAKSDGSDIKAATGDNPNNYNYYGMEFTTNGKLRYSYYDNAARKTRWFEYDLAGGATAEITAPAIDRESAVLSPDKKLRAYVSTRDGKANIYLSDPDGKNERRLTDINKVVGNLLWSKDGGFIIFNYRSDDESARYLVSINGKAKAKKIVDINLTYYY